MWGWFKLTTDRNAYSGFMGINTAANASTALIEVGTDVDGVSCKLWNASSSVAMFTASLNTWYFCALTRATSGGVATIYWRAETATVFSSTTIAVANFTATVAYWGGDTFTGEYLNGAIHGCGMADVALSADELLQISMYHEPQKLGIRSLNVFYHTIAATSANALLDSSGNVRPATATAGALADSPALVWVPPSDEQLVWITPASGGTTYYQTQSVTVTGAAGIIRSIGKVSTTSATGSPSVLRKLTKVHTTSATGSPSVVRSITKLFSASATGTPSVLRKLTKVFSQTASGTVSYTKTAVLFVIASVSALGTPLMASKAVIGKTFSVGATGTLSLVKLISKGFTATATGTLSLVKLITKPFLVGATGTASVTKRVSKSFAAAGFAGVTFFEGMWFVITSSSSVVGTVTFIKAFIPAGAAPTIVLIRTVVRFITRNLVRPVIRYFM